MRLLILFLIAFALGIGVALLASNTLAQRDMYPRSVMMLLQHHLGALHGMLKTAPCDAPRAAQLVRQLRHVADELEPALSPDATPDPTLHRYAEELRATLDQAIEHGGADCKDLARTTEAIGQRCDACHRDFR